LKNLEWFLLNKAFRQFRQWEGCLISVDGGLESDLALILCVVYSGVTDKPDPRNVKSTQADWVQRAHLLLIQIEETGLLPGPFLQYGYPLQIGNAAIVRDKSGEKMLEPEQQEYFKHPAMIKEDVDLLIIIPTKMFFLLWKLIVLIATPLTQQNKLKTSSLELCKTQ